MAGFDRKQLQGVFRKAVLGASMRIIILGGFLGSGKTTFLMQLVPFLAQQCDAGEKYPVVVLENEISMTDVDTRLLESRKMTVQSITAGCICCTSSAQLEYSVETIRREYAPQYLVIEATGMAFPDLIQENLQERVDDPIVIAALVDAFRWKRLKLAMPDFIKGQLCRASSIYINKTDLVSVRCVEQVISDIQKLFPERAVYPICAGKPLDDAVFRHLL